MKIIGGILGSLKLMIRLTTEQQHFTWEALQDFTICLMQNKIQEISSRTNINNDKISGPKLTPYSCENTLKAEKQKQKQKKPRKAK